MTTLTDFLLARIAEDEAPGRACGGGSAGGYAPTWCSVHGLPWGHGAIPRSARVLAECEAKRRIVELHEHHRSVTAAYRSPRGREVEDAAAAQDRRTQEARTRVAEDVLRFLALPYADHPDYREEWRP